MPSRRRSMLLVVVAGVAGLATLSSAAPGGTGAVTAAATTAAERPFTVAPRRAVPEDRFAMAGGCYSLRSVGTGGYLSHGYGTFVARPKNVTAPEKFHFRALDLGRYLLYGTQSDFLAGPRPLLADGVRPVTEVVEGYAKGTFDERIDPIRDPLVGGIGQLADGSDVLTTEVNDAVHAARLPKHSAEWEVRQAGNGVFTLHQYADDHDIANPGPLDAPVTGTLVVGDDGSLSIADGEDGGEAARFRLEQATDCAPWAEADIGVTGPVGTGATPYGEARGFVDAHLHMMAFEFLGGMARCGRPWHPYGISYALVDCWDHLPGGHGAILEAGVSGADPVTGHDTVGWPTFGYWPKHGSLTHEQVYYRWLERSWRGGLRMFTNLLVDNSVLCELYPLKKNSCNEMDGVRLQAQRLRELERYIDAQSGGPGEGWFRIVTDPFQARRVINAGKLAVIMGIEVSTPFDCFELMEMPRCSETDIEAQLDDVYAMGVRQMELTNKFDNALTGVTGDGGTFGLLVNNANRQKTGHNWKMQTCEEPANLPEHDHRHDKTQMNIADESDGAIGRDAIFGAVLAQVGPTGASQLYPASPHCNTIGLTDLGHFALNGLMKRGMLFDPDHMSAKGRLESMEHVAAAKYSGVVSSHSWADEPTYRAILRVGGTVTPHAGGSDGFVKKYRRMKSYADPRYPFGISFGSDINGFSTQGGPRNPDETTDVDYPFTSFAGVRVDKQVSGRRVFDINADGLAHHGLYPDWVEDVRVQLGKDGPAFLADLYRGAEQLLQTWERAVGVKGNSCRTDIADLSASDVGRIRGGMTPEQVLAAVGQPDSRRGTVFTYCGARGRVTVRFDGAGRVAGVVTGR